MHREDRLGPRGDRLLDQRLVDVQRVGADVDEDRPGPEPDDGVGGRDERERRQDHLVARPQVAQHGGHLERRRARRRHQHFRNREAILQDPTTSLREVAIAGDVAEGDSLGNVIKLFTGDERLVVGNP